MSELGANGLSKLRQARALGAHRWAAMDMLGGNRSGVAGSVITELSVARLGVVWLAEKGLVMAGGGATGMEQIGATGQGMAGLKHDWARLLGYEWLGYAWLI